MDPMEKKRKALRLLLDGLKTTQEKVAAGTALTQAEAEAADAQVLEVKALQEEIKAHDDRMRQIADAQEAGRKISNPVLPADDQPDESKKQKVDVMETKAADGKKAVGFMRLGDYVVAQKGIRDYVAAGLPKTQVVLANVQRLLARKGYREPLIPVSAEMVKAAYEAKAISTIGDGVIEPTRLPDFVRVTEVSRLQLRDVLDVQQTSSDAVKYTRIISYTRAAATVARSAQKPESPGLVLDAVTEPVKTIAVWLPVEDQQLSDFPALGGIINGELLYDVDRHLEELIMYGDGTAEDFTGLMKDPAVLDARSEVGDSLIDIARRGITDVRRAGYEPNAILVDPLDWETIVLEKGTDNRYVWVVVTDGATQRLWAVPVIETVAMEDFAGVTTEERNLVVGDFMRGATLWDRMQSQISVGYINDQFVRNQRTILAEMRAAFGIKRPGAFRKHQTQAPSSS